MPERDTARAVDPGLLSDVFCDLVESVALLGGEPVDCGDLEAGELGGLRLSICFRGDHRGWLAWYIGRGTGERIAGNILGQEVEDAFTRNRARETLKDLTRELCVHVLEAAWGEGCALQLGEPGIERSGPGDWEEQLAQGGLCFRIEGEPVLLQFREEDAPCR